LGQPLGSGPLDYLRKRLAVYGIDTPHFAAEPLPRPPKRRYRRQELQEAAARCGSLREMVAYLGIPPYSSLYSHLKRRMTDFGIDFSHFSDLFAGPRPGIGEPEIRRAVASSRSVAEVLRALGMPATGASRRRIARAIEAYGISTAHFVGQAHYRGRRAPNRLSADEILRVRAPGSPRLGRALLHRALQEKQKPYVCDECGTGELWRGKCLVLEIDHINGDRLDNRISNLRYLCPSCHSQTRTFSMGGRRRPHLDRSPGR
jgi:hypothetical protein